MAGGGAVGVQDQHLASRSGAMQVAQEGDHRGDPDAGRGEHERRVSLGQDHLVKGGARQ